MSLLAGTTWSFYNTPIQGTITFTQVGPDPRSGTVNINWGQSNSVQGRYAESTKDDAVVIILSTFGAAPDGSYPPPFGIPTINEDSQAGDPIPVVFTGVHASGIGTMRCTNTITPCPPSGSILADFTLSKNA